MNDVQLLLISKHSRDLLFMKEFKSANHVSNVYFFRLNEKTKSKTSPNQEVIHGLRKTTSLYSQLCH